MRLFFVCFVVLSMSVRALAETPGEAVRAMVDAERKFYQAGQEQGTRAAFLAFLADDSIVFRPGPLNGKKAWSKLTETGLDLIWEPSFAAMARSGDFGYDTGPARWKASKEEKKPLGYGEFVSVWKKQQDGAWKVALDLGIEHQPPGKQPEPTQLVLSDDGLNIKTDVEASRKNLREAEKRFAYAAKIDSTAAILAFATDDIRAFREGVLPSVGKDAAGLMLSVKRGPMTLESIGGDMSRTGDVAYRYGKYSIKRVESTEQGYYLQIWKTDAAGHWKLALDLQKNLPPPEKKPAS